MILYRFSSELSWIWLICATSNIALSRLLLTCCVTGVYLDLPGGSVPWQSPLLSNQISPLRPQRPRSQVLNQLGGERRLSVSPGPPPPSSTPGPPPITPRSKLSFSLHTASSKLPHSCAWPCKSRLSAPPDTSLFSCCRAITIIEACIRSFTFFWLFLMGKLKESIAHMTFKSEPTKMSHLMCR